MILTLMFVAVLIIGIVSGFLFKKAKAFSWQETVCELVCCFGLIIGIIGCGVCFLHIISSHTNGVEREIYMRELEYKKLLMQVELVDSEYEDVSKIEVIQKVFEWNNDVYSAKYWAYNPWTNWFYNRKLVDSLQYIDMEGLSR